MLLPELVSWLVGDGLGLTAATNLFYGILPDTPDLCVCLFEYPGLPNEITLGSTEVSQEIAHVQATVRGARQDYDTPRLLIHNIVKSFTKIGETNILGVRYGAVMARQAPFQVSPDDNFRHIFKCNFRVWKDPSTS